MLIHGRYRELIGVQHIKCYIFDDNLLISGANLCQQYFTNRQDRYMWICQSPNVCNFYHRLINAIGHYSFYLSSAVEYPMFSKRKPDPSFSTTEFKEQFKKEIAQLFNAACLEKQHKNQPSRASSDTWIFPTIQFKPAQILHDQEVCELLLTLGLQSKVNSTCCIASPYFNFTDTYQRCISMSEKQINIIVASPQANGFYKKGPLLGLIPHAYQYLLKKFLEALPSKTHVEVNEYRREYWTFHSKGLWLDLFTSNKSLPSASITAIGSSNFGVRSVERDLESQLIIFTKNNNLINHLKAEKKNLLKNSKPITSSSLNKETDLPSILIPFIASIARKYM
ncbi:probable CDP-diacylglycerol--glycerol-3-phosphate 3-phosphatidyltransferase isoform X2 [Schistocerca gregaria]|nr:probable CDP-diacylglycerol--glycerol-3-phosphate 3-phosphatidyltransferase isoform X2 [Schistocerca gregaria]